MLHEVLDERVTVNMVMNIRGNFLSSHLLLKISNTILLHGKSCILIGNIYYTGFLIVFLQHAVELLRLRTTESSVFTI
jgi:hypothetical protein